MFSMSGFMFRAGLATMTFDQIRPLGILIADYFFFLSLLSVLCAKERYLLKSRGSGVLAAGAIILCGALLAEPNATTIQMLVLFGFFAPLAIVHARNLRPNLLAIIGGITINCTTAILAAWVSPAIADILTVNPIWPTDAVQFAGRFGGLAGHPMILGLSAALAVLLAIGLRSFEKRTYIRKFLLLQIIVCTLAAMLSGSRNFVACLVPALLLLAFWRPLTWKVAAQTCAAVIGLLLAWNAINYVAADVVASYTERLSKTSADDPENSGRLLMAGVALEEIAQKPIWGWGMSHFGEAGMVYLPQDGDYMAAHVNLLQYWYAMGILGAIGFALLFVMPVRRMLLILKEHHADISTKTLRLGVCVYLLLFIASNLQPILLNRFLYMPLFLFAGLVAKQPAKHRDLALETKL